MRRSFIITLSAAVFGFAAPASALTATQLVEKEVIVTNADGSETLKRESAASIIPGERIVYTLNYTNDLDKDVSDLVLTMPVPTEVKFMEGSADARATIVTYSADGGQSFAQRQALTVQTAEGEWVQARSEDLTHVRWLVAGPVESGASGQLAFKGVLK